MGATNLKSALERKYAMFKGELGDKRERIDYIEGLFRDELPTLSEREKRLNRLVECAEEILKEIDPSFSPEKIKPVKPNVHKAPVEIGRISKSALDTLRESGKPMTIRQIADQIIVRENVGDVDKATHARLVNSIDSTLRQKEASGLVGHDGSKFARKWRILSPDERNAYLKPAKTSS